MHLCADGENRSSFQRSIELYPYRWTERCLWSLSQRLWLWRVTSAPGFVAYFGPEFLWPKLLFYFLLSLKDIHSNTTIYLSIFFILFSCFILFIYLFLGKGTFFIGKVAERALRGWKRRLANVAVRAAFAEFATLPTLQYVGASRRAPPRATKPAWFFGVPDSKIFTTAVREAEMFSEIV